MPKKKRRRVARRRAAWPRATLLSVVILLLAALIHVLLPPATPDVYGGLPQPQSLPIRLSSHVLRNEGFSLAYSEWWRTPLWVAYRLSGLPEGASPPRPDHFTSDRRTLWPVDEADYSHSGYDRGHMAPNHLIASLYGREAQRETFRMSNIVPQRPRLNQLLWQRIEALEADGVAGRFPGTYVLVGPVFDAASRRLDSGVAVPSAFYRIWLRVNGDAVPKALAFLVPQTVCGDEPLARYLVSVDTLEAVTGLDFFAALDDALEAQFESQPSSDFWSLTTYANRPARYANSFRGGRCTHE